jgi:hypothetical protein
MIDLQAVYIRDFIKLRDVSVVAMLRITAPSSAVQENFSTVTEARVGEKVTPFFRMPSGDLMLAIPDGVVSEAVMAGGLFSADVAVWLVAQRPGVESFRRRVVGDDFTTTVETSIGAPPTPDWLYQVPVDAMSVDTSMLRIMGQDFRKAVVVRVDGISVPFTVLNQTNLLCALPSNAQSIQEIDVVASSAKITGTSYFAFLLGDNPSTVSGVPKLVGQFIKGLLTTPGSSTFDKTFGAGMQKWAGQNTEHGGGTQAARAVMRIQQLAAQMTQGQLAANLPPEEVLLGVEVTDVSTSPSDPTIVNVSIVIKNLAGQLAAIDMLVGGVASVAQKAAAGA